VYDFQQKSTYCTGFGMVAGWWIDVFDGCFGKDYLYLYTINSQHNLKTWIGLRLKRLLKAMKRDVGSNYPGMKNQPCIVQIAGVACLVVFLHTDSSQTEM